MVINEYVKRWCDEEYDVRHEDFFVENAYYVSEKEWATHGFKHGLIAFVIAALIMISFAAGNFLSTLVVAGNVIAIFTACFYIFAMKEYDAHSVTGYIFYVMLAAFLVISLFVMPPAVDIIFIIAMFPLWVWSTIVRPIRFLKMKKLMKEKIEQMEREEEAFAQEQYNKWKKSYDSYRYGLPPCEESSYNDPVMAEARKLFDGFTADKQVLKSRYRQLAKQHHPDRGGDEKLMQCIIAVYDELCKSFV